MYFLCPYHCRDGIRYVCMRIIALFKVSCSKHACISVQLKNVMMGAAGGRGGGGGGGGGG